MPQHDDHCWLNVRGEGWAIRRIERAGSITWRIHLWRGYEPDLEFCCVELENFDIRAYSDAAARLLA